MCVVENVMQLESLKLSHIEIVRNSLKFSNVENTSETGKLRLWNFELLR